MFKTEHYCDKACLRNKFGVDQRHPSLHLALQNTERIESVDLFAARNQMFHKREAVISIDK